MGSEIPSSCLPDKYLTKNHLQELFNDFNSSMGSARPTAAIFSSLINSVRLAYTTPLLEAKEELLDQSKEYEQRLTELKYKRGGKSPAPLVEGVLGVDTSAERTGGELTEALTSPSPEMQISVNTFTLYIFSHAFHHRRDWASWDPTFIDEDRDEWTPRMSFKVFRFQEPGLINIQVFRKRSPVRSLAVRGGAPDHWWKEEIDFWAYEKYRPGTEMIWSGYQDGPERGIFVKGGSSEGMEDWERKCEFWVPL